MTILLCFLFLFSQTLTHAQPEDRELAGYIELFGLKGLPAAPPRNSALYMLGLRLFHDRQLSGKGNISCHACHSIAAFAGDNLPLGVGEGAEGLGLHRRQHQGPLLARHTPPLYNLGLPGVRSFFWDGRVADDLRGGWLSPEPGLNGKNPEYKDIAKTLDSLLALQALFPIASPEEMLGVGSPLSKKEAWEAVMHRLFNGHLKELYKRLFREAFPGTTEFNIGHVGNALAEWQRHFFLSNNTPWDKYIRGDKTAMTTRMKKGAILFYGKARCSNCHTGDHMTSFAHQSIGIPQIGPGVNNKDDKGLAEITGDSRHSYLFRIPPLRNVALTEPYMHSGVFKDLWEVIDHYDHPMRSLHHFSWDPKHPSYREDLVLDERRETMMERTRALRPALSRNLALSPEEKGDLFCFLVMGLTDQSLLSYVKKKRMIDEVTGCSPTE